MPRIDFSEVENADEFAPLPEGRYLCRVSQIEESATRNGDEMWRLTLSVIEGECEGRCIFDNMVFSSAAIRRAKLICSRLGLDVTGEVDLTPNMLEGRDCYVEVVIEEYTDEKGAARKRNNVPFAGYGAVAESEAQSDQGRPPF